MMKTFVFMLSCAALVACASEVVVLEPTAETRAALLCTLEPGADVCARSFVRQGEDSALARATVQDVVTLAGVATRARVEVEQACAVLLVALGSAPPMGQPSCPPAALALRELRESGVLLSLAVDPTTCREEIEQVPPCSSLASAPPKQLLCPVRIALGGGRDAAALEGSLTALSRIKGHMERAATLSAGISGGVQTLASQRVDCIPEISSLASQATTDLSEAVRAAGEVWSTFDGLPTAPTPKP